MARALPVRFWVRTQLIRRRRCYFARSTFCKRIGLFTGFARKMTKHPVLLPVGMRAQFRLDKEKIKLRVEDLDDKERDYIVVSMTQRESGSQTASSH